MFPPEALDVAESVPQAAPVHPVPESDHVTPSPFTLFCTVAVNTCEPVPAWRFALLGERETPTVFVLFLSALVIPAQPETISKRKAQATAKALLFFRNKSALESIKVLLLDRNRHTHVVREHLTRNKETPGLEIRGLGVFAGSSLAKIFKERYGSKGKFFNAVRTGRCAEKVPV